MRGDERHDILADLALFNFNGNVMSYKFKYADLLNDEVFKLVFGRESTKDVMIEFLNQVILDRKIVDLEFIDKEMHPIERDAKGTVYDMFCKTDDGSRIIVEVQRRKQPFYPERALYYSTFQIQRQVEAGAEYYDFLPVYVVSILDFKMDDDPDANAVRTAYRLYEEASHKLLTDRVTFIFIELPKFTKTVQELDGNILEGMYFCFKNMTELESRPEVLDHQIFTKIFDVTELYNMDQDTRDKVLENMTTERDLRNQMTYAREEGLAEGRVEGRVEGREEGREEGHVEERAKNAKNLRDLGVDPEIIAKATGLTVEDIQNL